jgi:hypothetical protein
MRIVQTVCTPTDGWRTIGTPSMNGGANLVLAFGARYELEKDDVLNELKQRYPAATIAGCSTAGEISGTNVLDGSVVCTAIQFDKTPISSASVFVKAPEDSSEGSRARSTTAT